MPQLRRLGFLIAFALAAALPSACGSTSQSVTSPSTLDAKCGVSATADPASFGPNGGEGKVAVSTNRECQWSVSADGGWIQLGNGTTGQGSGSVGFSVARNVDPAVRRGTIAVGNQQLTISQEAAPCEFTVSPASDTVSQAGGRRTIRVTASSPQCTWTARADASWLRIVEGAQGSGSGQVVYEATPTTGPTRTGTLLIAGHSVAVTQGGGCSTSIAPTSQTVGAGGGSGSIAVTTGPGCVWTAQSDAPWITITSGATGTGPGSVAFSVGAWDGPTRTGTLRVDTHTFVVTQTAAECTYSLSPSAVDVTAGGGTGQFDLTTAAHCAWTARSNADWITLTSAASGSGSARVTFSVSANGGAARSGTITAGGQTFTVNQAGAGCTYSIAPTSETIGAGSRNSSFALTTASHCAWTAVSTAPDWLTVTSPASGSGSATITFSVPNNSGPERTGTIVAGGQTFTVIQTSGCTFSLSATSADVAMAGGTGTVRVSTAPGCTWTATSPEPWVTITPGGTGTADAQFVVAQNLGPPRSATLLVAGQGFTVSQGGCTYSISPSSARVTAAAGTGQFSLTTEASCSWTAASSVPWITLTSPPTGAGSATVTFSFEANPNGTREGTITVGGQTFTLTQTGP